MSVTIRVPGSLSYLIQNNKIIECEVSGELGRCIDSLNIQFPGFKEGICDAENNLLDHINIYINGENVRYMQGVSTILKDGDNINIIPAAAAG